MLLNLLLHDHRTSFVGTLWRHKLFPLAFENPCASDFERNSILVLKHRWDELIQSRVNHREHASRRAIPHPKLFYACTGIETSLVWRWTRLKVPVSRIFWQLALKQFVSLDFHFRKLNLPSFMICLVSGKFRRLYLLRLMDLLWDQNQDDKIVTVEHLALRIRISTLWSQFKKRLFYIDN